MSGFCVLEEVTIYIPVGQEKFLKAKVPKMEKMNIVQKHKTEGVRKKIKKEYMKLLKAASKPAPKSFPIAT